MAEFVTIIALMMALSALAIDAMLPALPAISDHFALAGANDRQLVVTAYLVGFALGQPIHGPLSDRYGRKPVLMAGLVLFAAGAALAAVADSFDMLLLARTLQGLGVAAARVISNAVVRDCFSGREMARVMSLAMMVFITVPIIAPAVGAGILLVADWHSIFLVLLAMAGVTAAWVALRLPETRDPADRLPLSLPRLGEAARAVVRTRTTLGYTVALGLLFGILMAYIATAQQIFGEIYGMGAEFPLFFAALALSVAAASLTNAGLVSRFGMRRLSHIALIGLVVLTTGMAVAGFPGRPSLVVLSLWLGAAFFCFGLVMANFNAIAMEPLGRIAGMAASFIGFLTTLLGAVGGWAIGQAFDGSVRPLTIGFTFMAWSALAVVLVTERGRLFGGR
jgi:DHA1 family bicyclomycin/chloramphenicol resistance-like MFS transporter